MNDSFVETEHERLTDESTVNSDESSTSTTSKEGEKQEDERDGEDDEQSVDLDLALPRR